MRYRKIVAAVPALQKLSAQQLPLSLAYRLAKTVGKLNEELAFFGVKHKKIAEAEASEEDKAALFEELMDFETDWNPEPLRIPADANVVLSCYDIQSLEGLVEIYEKEEGHDGNQDKCAG